MGTFDVECEDGLNGTRMFCWAIAARGIDKDRPAPELCTIQGGPDEFDALFQPGSPIDGSNLGKYHYRVIYVHNLGFDARFVMDACARQDVEFTVLGRSGMLALIIPSLQVRFVDSVQFLKCSQEQAEEEWDVDPALRKIDCADLFETSFEDWTDADKDRVRAHNRNDVKALFHIMDGFRKKIFELSNVDPVRCVSVAQLAMKCFRKSMTTPIPNAMVNLVKPPKGRWFQRANLERDKFIRDAYRGGRTEVFHAGTHHHVTCVDIVSQYPGVMKHRTYPGKLLDESTDPEFIEAQLMDDESVLEGFVNCHVTPPDDLTYPILPEVRDGKMMFTLLPRRGTYALPELRHALARGYEIDYEKPIHAMFFERLEGKDLFGSHVDTYYHLKDTSTGGTRKCAKVILNGLYGKFGEKFVHHDIDRYKVKRTPERVAELDAKMQRQAERFGVSETQYKLSGEWIIVTEPRDIHARPKAYMNVGIGAYVTSWARLQMVQMFEWCEGRGIEVLYCDTDSIFIYSRDLVTLQAEHPDWGRHLGGWDVEAKFSEVRFLSPKSYLFVTEADGSGMKMKGLRGDIREGLFDKHGGDLDAVEQELRDGLELDARYLTYKQALIQGNSYLASSKRSRRYTFINDKRDFAPDGTSIPWTVKSWNEHVQRAENPTTPFFQRQLNLYQRLASATCPTCREKTYVDLTTGRLVAGCDHYREVWDTGAGAPAPVSRAELTMDGRFTGFLERGHVGSDLKIRFHKPPPTLDAVVP
jgi:hypothetical protein